MICVEDQQQESMDDGSIMESLFSDDDIDQSTVSLDGHSTLESFIRNTAFKIGNYVGNVGLGKQGVEFNRSDTKKTSVGSKVSEKMIVICNLFWFSAEEIR